MDLKSELTPEQYQKLKAKPRDKQKEFVTQYVMAKGFTPKKSATKKVVDFGKGFAMGSAGKLATGSAKGISNIFGEGAARVYEGTGIIGGALGADKFENRMRSLGETMRGLKQETGQASNTLSGIQNRAIKRAGSEGKIGAITGELATYIAPATSLGKGKVAIEGASKLANTGRMLSRRILPEAALDVGMMKAYDLTDNESRTTAVNTGLSVLGAGLANTPFGRFFKKGKQAIDEVAEVMPSSSARKVQETAERVKNIGSGPNSVQKFYQTVQDSLGDFSPKFKELGDKAWFDKNKLMQNLTKQLDGISSRYSAKTIARAEDYLDSLRKGVEFKGKDKDVIAAANEINTVFKQVRASAVESGIDMGDISYYVPKDYTIPTDAEKLNKYINTNIVARENGANYILKEGETLEDLAEEIMKKNGQTREQVIKSITEELEPGESLGSRFGKFYHSRDIEPPEQTRDLVTRAKEYLESASGEISKTKNFGKQTSPGKYENLERLISEEAPLGQSSYVRDTMRALLGDSGSKWDKTISQLRTQKNLSEKNTSPLLLIEDGFKLANTVSSMIMGFSATLWDILGNPARIGIAHLTDLRSLGQLFNSQLIGRASEVEAAAKRMGLFDSQANILRDKDIELAPQLIDAYFKLIGQKGATNVASKLNIRAGSAKLQGLANSKKLSKADIDELKTEFGLTDELISNIKNLEMEDFIGAVIYNTTQKIMGRGGGELVMASQWGSIVKGLYKFMRFPLLATSEVARQAKRNPGKTATATLGTSYGYGYGLEQIEDSGVKGSQTVADVMGVSEKDEGRNYMVKMGKYIDEELNTDDIKVAERTMRGLTGLLGLDLIVNKLLGDQFGTTTQKVLVSPGIMESQIRSTFNGLKGLLEDGTLDESDIKDLSRGVGAARDLNKLRQELNQ